MNTTLPALGAMILFWALTPITIAYVKNDFSLIFQVWARYTISSLALWTVVLSRRDLRLVLKDQARQLVRMLIPVLLMALATLSFQLNYTYCFFLIDPGFGILLYQSQVIFSIILGGLFFTAERKLLKSRKTLGAIVLALAGAAVVILFQNQGVSFTFNRGILFALAAALSWSFVGVVNRGMVKDRLPPLITISLVFTAVALILIPAVLLDTDSVIADPGLTKWIVLLGSGILGNAGGQGLYYYLLPRVGLITAASVQLLVPFLTGLFSYLFFREQITLLQGAGGLVLLAGCRMIIKEKAKQMKTAPPEGLDQALS
ncbi:MAG: DMT family transporter [Spirochaetales bacterium]|nr:DMT family transporter [Spirochaetales bacterium]